MFRFARVTLNYLVFEPIWPIFATNRLTFLIVIIMKRIALLFILLCIEYEIESSGSITLMDGFSVENGATFAVYPSCF